MRKEWEGNEKTTFSFPLCNENKRSFSFIAISIMATLNLLVTLLLVVSAEKDTKSDVTLALRKGWKKTCEENSRAFKPLWPKKPTHAPTTRKPTLAPTPAKTLKPPLPHHSILPCGTFLPCWDIHVRCASGCSFASCNGQCCCFSAGYTTLMCGYYKNELPYLRKKYSWMILFKFH